MDSDPRADHALDAASVVYDPDACRAWLAGEHGVHDMSTTDLTIAAGLDRLLDALDHEPPPRVWRTTGALQRVRAWRTADGDGL